jgi:hypothetical protein
LYRRGINDFKESNYISIPIDKEETRRICYIYFAV